jgi:hypothetical protein
VDSKIQIRVFSLSSKDIFLPNRLDNAIYWLMKKGNNCYYFRERKPKDFPAGSIAVFSFEGRFFGQAITNKEVLPLSGEEQKRMKRETGFLYTGAVRFEPSSIDVFSKYPEKKDVEKTIGKSLSRNLITLTWDEYQEILKMAGRRP